MINRNMFSGEPTINDYRDMVLDDILKEYLYFKGTWDDRGNEINKAVAPKELVGSALFIYGLKNNPTNKRSAEYYCEREARRRLILRDGEIVIPAAIWKECDSYNRTYCTPGVRTSKKVADALGEVMDEIVKEK